MSRIFYYDYNRDDDNKSDCYTDSDVLEIIFAGQINYLPTSTNRNTLDKASVKDNEDDDIGAFECM